jgi:hypothetical protein
VRKPALFVSVTLLRAAASANLSLNEVFLTLLIASPLAGGLTDPGRAGRPMALFAVV